MGGLRATGLTVIGALALSGCALQRDFVQNRESVHGAGFATGFHP